MSRQIKFAATQRPAVIVAQNGRQAQLAHELAPQVPLVFSTQTDPRELGIASALLQRPEPSTGIWFNDDLLLKRIELLMEAYPSARVIAALGDQDWYRSIGDDGPKMLALARERGVELRILGAASPDEAIGLVESAALEDVQAWCIPRSLLTLDGRLFRHLAKLGKAAMASHTPDIDEGAHLSYAFDRTFQAPALADLTARVLNGERPGSIPIQTPERIQLVIRLADDPRLPALNPAVMRRADLIVR